MTNAEKGVEKDGEVDQSVKTGKTGKTGGHLKDLLASSVAGTTTKNGPNETPAPSSVLKPPTVGDAVKAEAKKEAKAKEKWEKKLYKPTGPDGKGWGDFREQTERDKIILEELLKIEKKEQ